MNSACLWFLAKMIVLPMDATAPLREVECELIENAKPAVARAESEIRQLEARLKTLENMAAQGKDAANREAARREADQVAEQLASMPKPVLPRRICDNATTEKIEMMLAEQEGRLASMSAEGNVFDLMAGKYSKQASSDIDVYLKAHSGDPLCTDRVGRGGVRVERPSLTCLYAVQPEVISKLTANLEFRGRGLLARFLFAMPRSLVGEREVAAEPVHPRISKAYRQVVRRLAALNGEAVLKLQSEAAVAFEDWEREIEKMLAEGGEMEHMLDWGSKLAGATLRLAAVLHCVKFGPEGEIGEETLASAITIARYLICHAEAVLTDTAAAEGTVDADARYVLRWIKRHGKQEFTERDVHQHGKRRFARATEVVPALEVLKNRHYIRRKPEVKAGPGRPPSPSYEVNPLVFAPEATSTRSQYSQNPPSNQG